MKVKKVPFISTGKTNPNHMKNLATFCCALLIAFGAGAQEPIHFFAHEEQVKPAMNAAYVDWLKKVKTVYQNAQAAVAYNTFAQDDYTWYFFTPMKSLNVHDVNQGFAEAASKVGNEVFQKLYAEKGKYIDARREMIVDLLPQFSYLAPGEGENYRHAMFWFPLEGMEAEVDRIGMEWVELHRSKNSPNGYQTFKTVIGGESGYVFVRWGKDQADFYAKTKKGNEVMGEDGAKLWRRTLDITRKIYYKGMWYRPDLSYSPPAPAMAR